MGRTTVPTPTARRHREHIEIAGHDGWGNHTALHTDEAGAAELLLSLTRILGDLSAEADAVYQTDRIGAFRLTTKPELERGRWVYASTIAVNGEDILRVPHDGADAAKLGHRNLLRWLALEVRS